MSNLEHLIDNAITTLEEGKDFDFWMSLWYTKEQLKKVQSPPEEIWEIANYCYYSYREQIIWETNGCPVPED